MHVVIENDDAHHHPHAEEQRVFTVEPACVLSVKHKNITFIYSHLIFTNAYRRHFKMVHLQL